MADSRRGVRSVLRVVEVLLLAVAVVSIGWYATAHILAAREQASLSRELDRIAGPNELQELAQTRPATTTTTTDTTTTAPRKTAASARGLIGRIEMPRLKLSVM